MRTAAIFHVWDDYELCLKSIRNISPLVDGVIVVASELSNNGEKSRIPGCWLTQYAPKDNDFNTFIFEPDLNKSPQENERNKRNFGLSIARNEGYTHFIMLDADEFYEPEALLKEKQRFIDNPDLAGLVCGLKCYFKLPTLTVPDKTLVPFIHKITPELSFTWNTKYPFAFEGPKREIRIDPTRHLNINSGVEWSDITMHHFSWIRRDIKKKIRNSTARENIEKSTIVSDYMDAKAGYYCEFYKATLVECENLFNIPDIIDNGLNP